MYRTIHKILRYDTIRYIQYAHCIVRFMSTYNTLIRYEIFYTQYDMYRTTRIAYRTILTTMYVAMLILLKKIVALGYCQVCYLRLQSSL